MNASEAKTVAEWLELPAGFVATRYVSGIEIQEPAEPGTREGPRHWIALPYSEKPRKWWIEQSRKNLPPRYLGPTRTTQEGSMHSATFEETAKAGILRKA